jgi:predicted dehydrogenase
MSPELVSERRVRTAVLGAGAWGKNHVRVVAAHPGCQLVAVADPDRGTWDRVRALAAPGLVGAELALSADPDAALAAGVEAVVIATPAPTHAPLALRALAAGCHVLVEKPMALSLADAIAVRASAQRAGRVGMVGHQMVFHPAVIRLRQLLGAGELGALRYVHSARASIGRLRREETVLWSLGPHDLSMFDFLLGSLPVSVAASGHCMVHPGIEDVAFLTLRYAGGVAAHVHLSWLHPRKERRLTLVGSHKLIELDDVSPEKVRIYDRAFERPPEFTEFAQYLAIRDGDVHIPRIPMVEPLAAQLDHFVARIRGARGPGGESAAAAESCPAGLHAGVRVTAVLEAAQRSLALGGAPVPPATDSR